MAFANIGEYKNFVLGVLSKFYTEQLEKIQEDSITTFGAFELLYRGARAVKNNVKFEELDALKSQFVAFATSYKAAYSADISIDNVMNTILKWEEDYRTVVGIKSSEWFVKAKAFDEGVINADELKNSIEGFDAWLIDKDIDLTYNP